MSKDKISITFDDRHRTPNNNYSVYSIRLDGVVVANVYGSMAAIATEAICRYFESGEETIKVIDFMKRVPTRGGNQ